MTRDNRTTVAPERLCPTCGTPLRVHEWRTVAGNGTATPWTEFRQSCDRRCAMVRPV